MLQVPEFLTGCQQREINDAAERNVVQRFRRDFGEEGLDMRAPSILRLNQRLEQRRAIDWLGPRHIDGDQGTPERPLAIHQGADLLLHRDGAPLRRR